MILGMCWYVNLFISLNFSYQQFVTMCAKMCTDYVTGLFKQLVSLLLGIARFSPLPNAALSGFSNPGNLSIGSGLTSPSCFTFVC